MAVGKTGARVLSTALILVLLAGCGAGRDAEIPLDTLTAEEIYKRGELALETSSQPTEAIRLFSEVERLYPYTEWSKRALIMQAFALHQDRQYEDRAPPHSAISISTRARKTRPMPSIFWPCPITTRSTRSAAIRA
jgi:hypothetical protein